MSQIDYFLTQRSVIIDQNFAKRDAASFGCIGARWSYLYFFGSSCRHLGLRPIDL